MKKYILLLILLFTLFLTGCSEKEYSSDQYQDETAQKECYEPENPYSSSEEWHYAWYEWAVENDPSSCWWNSDSFIEGCEEYLRQVEDYNTCME